METNRYHDLMKEALARRQSAGLSPDFTARTLLRLQREKARKEHRTEIWAYNDISDLAGTRRLGRVYTLFLRYTPFKRKRKRYSPDDKKKFQTLPCREPAILRTGTPCRHTFICRLLVEKTLVQFPTKSVRHIILSHTYFLYTSPDNYRSLWSSYKLKRGNI